MDKSMLKAIKNRRMGRLSDLDEMKDDAMNPDEGSTDDLSIHLRENDQSEDLLPDEALSLDQMSPISEEDMGLDAMAPPTRHMDAGKEVAAKLFNKDNLGRPSIQGKANALMKAKLKQK